MRSQFKWDVRFLKLAELVASWSKDPSTQCGSVIVDSNLRIVSMGFNGFPVGVEDTSDRLDDRNVKLRIVLHAEENAILFSRTNLTGHTMYTWPFGPCGHCSAKIIQSGISCVKYPICEDADRLSRWENDILLGEAIRKEVGMRSVRYSISTLKNEGLW